jgi:hypothetical protein
VFGAIAFGISFVVLGPDRRPVLRSAGASIALSFVLACAVVSPYLYYVLAYGIPRRQPIGADLLSFFLPTTMTRLHAATFDRVIQRFPGSLRENTAYLGLPLIFVFIRFAMTRWRTVAGKVVLWSFAVVWMASLGETLFVGGRRTTPLPWRAIGTLPLLNNAFPRRFTMYVFLLMAVMLAMWLSASRWRWRAWSLALLVPVFLFPGPALVNQHARAHLPRFFEAGTYRRYIRPGETILIASAGGAGGPFPQSRSMVIQAETGFWFRMVAAYTGPLPPEYERSVILQALAKGAIPPVAASEFQRFLRSHQVEAIVLERASPLEPGLTALVGHPPLTVQDVVLYMISAPPAGGLASTGPDQAASRRFFLPRAM